MKKRIQPSFFGKKIKNLVGGHGRRSRVGVQKPKRGLTRKKRVLWGRKGLQEVSYVLFKSYFIRN